MAGAIEAGTMGQLLREAAARFGSAEAVVGNGTRLTFDALDERSRVTARHLLGRGVGKGDRIGVSFGNGPDFIVALTAVCRIGAIAVPISTFAPGRELHRLIRHGDMAGVLTASHVVGVDQVRRLEQAVPGLAGSERPQLALPAAPMLRWIEFTTGDVATAWVSSPGDHGVLGLVDEELLAAVEAEVTPYDVCLMIHTSGTTADPKGVPHLHDTVTFRARDLAERMQFAAGDRTYTSQVLFWIGGLTMSFVTSLAAGGTSIWHERFDAGEVLRLIERERISRLAIYPHQVEQLLAHPEFASTDRTSLRIADPRLAPDGASSALLTPDGDRMALGMTETFGPYSWGSGGSGPIAPIESVQPGLEVRVVDPDLEPVADGGTGEICLRGRCVTPGYHRRPRDSGFDADGWFHTGDRGRRDGAAIHFLGRMVEMIKTSGANVAPAEVVEALLAVDGVAEAYVVPLEDPLRGEVVAAAVVLDADSDLDAHDLQAALRGNLSPFKIPGAIGIFSSQEIPWTPTFKVRRPELTDMISARTASAPR
ncbi:class I adenylate-forming enzyme family protein [Blastococcus sp. URHD0036]|uniref:class I adenylate-forming enzyme family protein n=1 Tax=Blastococcus sp. URHD0036 TaxID=1380356 RepID=UPI000498305E|nr:class I adenylate-forming enzyme family protein [Blastococcus sp. URHD0036]